MREFFLKIVFKIIKQMSISPDFHSDPVTNFPDHFTILLYDGELSFKCTLHYVVLTIENLQIDFFFHFGPYVSVIYSYLVHDLLSFGKLWHVLFKLLQFRADHIGFSLGGMSVHLVVQLTKLTLGRVEAKLLFEIDKL